MKESVLEIRNLHKSFDENIILDGISLDVKKGEVVVVLGPSGCGKSTLLRCVNGLEEIQDGEIIKNGEVGMVFQNYELFPHKTILENITLAPVKVQKRDKQEAKNEAMELLRLVGIEEKASQYPRELSGGQKQRVAIVRALAMHPEILLLDEITASLDPEMVREVLEVVMELADEGKTMVIVTHEMAFAKAVADRIIFLEKGKIVEESSPELFFNCPKTERAKQFLNAFSYERKQSMKMNLANNI